MPYCPNCGAEQFENTPFCRSCGKSVAILLPRASNGGVAAATAPAREVRFYEDESIVVTNTRFVVPGQTYAVANVTSVRMEEIWKDGELQVEYRKPFDVLAVSSGAECQKKTVQSAEIEKAKKWLLR